jgi:hypothetical protein
MLNNAKHGGYMPTKQGTSKVQNFNSLLRENFRLARSQWPNELGSRTLCALKRLSREFGLSLASNDILLLDGGWYVTAGGLLRMAVQRQCHGIHAFPVSRLCDAEIHRWVFRAIVYKSSQSKGFVGYGDADPSNVSPMVHGAEMRVAETRAVNRALRKAYGIGLCSVEELGWAPRSSDPDKPTSTQVSTNGTNGHHNGQPRLRDRLCLLIRKHQLDANLVKAYAADYCGTATLKGASRDLVEAFINDLAERAAKDREGLLCHLNSYAKPQEVNS